MTVRDIREEVTLGQAGRGPIYHSEKREVPDDRMPNKRNPGEPESDEYPLKYTSDSFVGSRLVCITDALLQRKRRIRRKAVPVKNPHGGITEIGARVNPLIGYFGAFIKDYQLEKYFFEIDRRLVTRPL